MSRQKTPATIEKPFDVGDRVRLKKWPGVEMTIKEIRYYSMSGQFSYAEDLEHVPSSPVTKDGSPT